MISVASLICILLLALPACGTSPADGDPDPGVYWSAQSASLTADDFSAVVQGVTFHGVSAPQIEPSPVGDKIEVEWDEAGYHERFYLGFRMTSGGWTADDIRVYNLAYTDWHELEGNFFAAPLGSSFHGDIDITIDTQAAIHFGNATVSPFGAR